MKTIRERYYELFGNTYGGFNKVWHQLNAEYFNNKLKIDVGFKNSYHGSRIPYVSINGIDDRPSFEDDLKYLESLYDLQQIKKKIKNINENNL